MRSSFEASLRFIFYVFFLLFLVSILRHELLRYFSTWSILKIYGLVHLTIYIRLVVAGIQYFCFPYNDNEPDTTPKPLMFVWNLIGIVNISIILAVQSYIKKEDILLLESSFKEKNLSTLYLKFIESSFMKSELSKYQ